MDRLVPTSLDLRRFKRLGLAHLPTPLEPLRRLSAHLGGPRLWVKRDDCTGLGLGGNKLRKLDHVLREAIKLAAALEGLVLDPVYSGKGLAGLIALIRSGRWTSDQDIVFIHTGGAPALFAYRHLFD